jgi:hypothetical protein
MYLEQYEIDEINAERQSILAEQEAEQAIEYQSDLFYNGELFADTWDAEPFDTSELIVTADDDDLPEWMMG